MDYEGYRVHRYTDGSVFSGVWEGGRKKGLGVMQLADGAVYEGEFSSACAVVPPWVNKAAAAGVVVVVMPRCLSGEGRRVGSNAESHYPPPDAEDCLRCAGDLFSGLGRIFHQNGSGYIGQFDRGVRHGFGEYTDVVRGEVFTGEWSDDRRGSNSHLDRAVPRGAGTHAWDDKSRYQVSGATCLSRTPRTHGSTVPISLSYTTPRTHGVLQRASFWYRDAGTSYSTAPTVGCKVTVERGVV
jgi:hypothetical protein